MRPDQCEPASRRAGDRPQVLLQSAQLLFSLFAMDRLWCTQRCMERHWNEFISRKHMMPLLILVPIIAQHRKIITVQHKSKVTHESEIRTRKYKETLC